MKALNNKELEFKYAASDISLTDFLAWAKSLKPLRTLYVCGYDHFFENKADANMFIRHRVGMDFNQLTVKRKLAEKNNFIRDEINIMLAKSVSEETAAAMATAMGYEFNFTIFKTVFVYDYENFTLSFYTVTDANLKELGRFMEIEMSEDADWSSESEAWDLLRTIELQASEKLGISHQARIKKSLYEQFRK